MPRCHEVGAGRIPKKPALDQWELPMTSFYEGDIVVFESIGIFRIRRNSPNPITGTSTIFVTESSPRQPPQTWFRRRW
jgi:hypothetical protein